MRNSSADNVLVPDSYYPYDPMAAVGVPPGGPPPARVGRQYQDYEYSPPPVTASSRGYGYGDADVGIPVDVGIPILPAANASRGASEPPTPVLHAVPFVPGVDEDVPVRRSRQPAPQPPMARSNSVQFRYSEESLKRIQMFNSQNSHSK
jgi:hypothetical protein